MKNEKQRKAYQRHTILLVLALIIILGSAYGWLTVSLKGQKTNTIVVGTLSLKLDDSITEGINLKSAYPITDEKGLETKPYTFKITNDGNIASTYSIYLDNEELDSKYTRMDEKYIKYSIVKNGVRQTPQLLKNTNTSEGRLLDTGTLEVGQTNTYDLRLWIDEQTKNDVMKTMFSGRIRVEAEQIKE